MQRRTLAPDGRKRERSENAGSIRYSYPNAPKGLLSHSPHSAFTVWRDDDLVKELHPPKRIRRDSNAHKSLMERDMNKDMSISPVDQGRTSKSMKAPSLKSKAIIRSGKTFDRDSRASLAMDLSSPANVVSYAHSSILAPRQSVTAQGPVFPFPSLLKSPFKPSKRRSKHKKVAQVASDSMFRHPSDGITARRFRLLDSRRHPSDSSTSKRQNTRNPFLKDLGPFPQPQRHASFFDDLQKAPSATPETAGLYKSPSITMSTSGLVPELIPRVPAFIDTPSNDTDQLIADMSEFSLAPKPCSLQLTPPSVAPIHEEEPVSMQIRDSTPIAATQSSPGISIPSIDDSWFADKQDPHSTPVKGSFSSEDELNLLLPMHYLPPAGSSKQPVAKAVGGAVQRQPPSLRKTYGKKKSRKSVTFAPEHKVTINALRHSSDEQMDTSDDELLLR